MELCKRTNINKSHSLSYSQSIYSSYFGMPANTDTEINAITAYSNGIGT